MKKNIFIMILLLLCCSFSCYAEDTELQLAQTEGFSLGSVDNLSEDISRQQLCELIMLLYDKLGTAQEIPQIECSFTDTDNEDIKRAYSLGIVSGVSETEFAPKNNASREQLCVMLVKAISKAIPESDITIHGVYHFNDESYIDYWAKDYVNYAYHHGIMQGVSDYTIDPLRNITCAETIRLVYRTYKNADSLKVAPPDSEIHEWLIEPKYEHSERQISFSGGLAAVKYKDKFGYIDKNGKTVIGFEFDTAHPFADGYARVKKDDKYAFIDKSGTLITDFEYEDAGDFSLGLAWVKKDDKFGFINSNGDICIPLRYDYAGNFSQGFAAVSIGSKYGYIDNTGNMIIPATFDYAADFSEDLAQVDIGFKSGFINKNGEIVIPCIYDDAENFACSKAVVYNQGKYGTIDKNGNTSIPFGWYSIIFGYSENLLRVRGGGMWESSMGYINNPTEASSIQIPFSFNDASEFSEGIAWVRNNTNYKLLRTYIDKNGNILLPKRASLKEFSEYDDIFNNLHSFSEGVAAVETIDGKVGFIKNPLL